MAVREMKNEVGARGRRSPLKKGHEANTAQAEPESETVQLMLQWIKGRGRLGNYNELE